MIFDEMKLAVCEKLPELVVIYFRLCCWSDTDKPINWSTEGLQVCHEAEKLLGENESEEYMDLLSTNFDLKLGYPNRWRVCNAPYEQRLEALCRVWYPERFK